MVGLIYILWAITSLLSSTLSSSWDPRVIRGVNIGGWLLTEEWITPSLYDSTDAADEWHLCNELGQSVV